MIRRINFIICAAAILSWLSVYSQDSDTLVIEYNYINSEPQNAEIYVNDELIGNTPYLFVWKDSLFPKTIKVKLKGYADFTENIYDPVPVYKNYKLVRLKGGRLLDPVKEDKTTYFNKPRKVIPIVISSVFTAAAGFSAYYFKSLAIDNRDEYDVFGDEAALERKKKYDIISGVSLAVFQVGLGALMYYLFIDN